MYINSLTYSNLPPAEAEAMASSVFCLVWNRNFNKVKGLFSIRTMPTLWHIELG